MNKKEDQYWEEDYLDMLERAMKEEAEYVEIPESVLPENMLEKLKNVQQTDSKKKKIQLTRILGVAACFIGVVGLSLSAVYFAKERPAEQGIKNTEAIVSEAVSQEVNEGIEKESKQIPVSAKSYDQVYQVLKQVYENGMSESARIFEMYDYAMTADTVEDGVSTGTAELNGSISKTNTQVEDIDEADVIKVDGNYIYYYNCSDASYETYSIDIIKVNGSEMEKAGEIQGSGQCNDFYVTGNQLILFQTVYDNDNTITKILFYDITNRENPVLTHTLTQDGALSTSRLTGGYLYTISQYAPYQLYRIMEDESENVEDCVPSINNAKVEPERIIIPENPDAAGFLVVTAVSLEDTADFKDYKAVISSGDQFYMSKENLYIADTCYAEEGEKDSTQITKLSYADGTIIGEVTGKIDGHIGDTFAMDEYEGNLRVVTTVSIYEEVDSEEEQYMVRMEPYAGISILPIGQTSTTNALFVMDANLNVIGKIENLAEGERVYSARFFGDTGYFVTFRQVDPLFSVDLSNPEKPVIVGELKITGFSEYLHFWSDNLLLGIGNEVDPETNATIGLKLSMFDISDPENVVEKDKIVLENCYSQALYNHKAVLIDPKKNILGFDWSGNYITTDDYKNGYLIYGYDEDQGFTERIKSVSDSECNYFYNNRGVYIGNTLYIVDLNGVITAYDLTTREQTGQIKVN
ncbi:beta-propeller domain-containing protein [Anaeromicropila populeti]|uniref:Secreted protein containing C-terminal beta-propeller domain n=1 Tax=Anaeromicropila populeti TaxID=37658 RepID=A0A1I6KS14_9FIRM|nr:beta-propeller domain-containing protein [Anaeromicropila populeti]SFR93991.1 Secreted protein containing C-terminal beta-propeller domain [Anaeromicropila populeti]